MLNKKGFTIAEVLVSFSLIAVVLASVISATLYYRNRLKQEEVVNQLNDFKNTITKIVYDDIIDNNVVRVERCVAIQNCVNFIDNNNQSHILKIDDFEDDILYGRSVYLFYNDKKYMLPDSDLVATYKLPDNSTETQRVCDFIGGIELETYDNKLYKVKATFHHRDLDLKYDLLFVVSQNN